ncbi:hypothetical protein ILYODFUR_004673 [Ilyodon furcidens]|uniref:Integrase zinc-binding domain-containing protein n=1 Tax=Ilyodon furcidens TaxID=33524 RepID=A0ABV0SVG6_9TELE
MAGYFGILKIKANIRRHFYCPWLHRDEGSCCHSCHACQALGKPNQENCRLSSTCHGRPSFKSVDYFCWPFAKEQNKEMTTLFFYYYGHFYQISPFLKQLN